MRLQSPMEIDTIYSQEFATAMLACGLNEHSKIAIGVSGGADSTALALLTKNWCLTTGASTPIALVCDHGLRSESNQEAHLTIQRLEDIGLPSYILKLNLTLGTAIQERARIARYSAMLQRMRELGLDILLVGHHRMDQAETIALRLRSNSGDDGLAGMSYTRYIEDALLARPLLKFSPDRLRTILYHAKLSWVEDPSNCNEAFSRVRIRKELEQHPDEVNRLIEISEQAWMRRQKRDKAARFILDNADLTQYPAGFMSLNLSYLQGNDGTRALGMMIVSLVGGMHPHVNSLKRLLATGHGTLGGTVLFPGSHGKHWLAREPAAIHPPVKTSPWIAWDRRFRLDQQGGLPDATIGAVGQDAKHMRSSALSIPQQALWGTPCYRIADKMVSVPHFNWGISSPHPTPYEHNNLKAF
jgi:tRNA(Ile)-lysidine synthase